MKQQRKVKCGQKEAETLAKITDETATQRKQRLSQARQMKQQRKVKRGQKEAETLAKITDETATQRKRRLSQARQMKQQRKVKCGQKEAETLAKITDETATQRKRRLLQKRRLFQNRQRQHKAAKNLEKNMRKQRQARAKIVESSNQRTTRLASCRRRMAQIQMRESSEQRSARLQVLRQAYIQRRVSFNAVVNTFCDKSCEICHKMCYPNQVVIYRLSTVKPYLPHELASKPELVLCHRCNNHLRGKKDTPPSKAYWNNLLPGQVPEEISVLTEPDRRLLQRIIPYVKIIKFPGRFGQYGFKGHATLFALDIFEVTEKIPTLLPRASTDIGMVVVTETLDNSNMSRRYNISPDHVYKALYWLIKNNPLYKDVTVNESVRLNTQDVVRVIPVEQQPHDVENHNADVLLESSYMPINNLSRILHASWHQGNTDIFSSEYAGRQCFAMVISNFIRATILAPSQWNTNVINDNMIQGNGLYICIDVQTRSITGAFPIPQNGYLETRNIDVVRHDVLMFGKTFTIEYDDVTASYHGSLCDYQNDGVNFLSLRTAINLVFTSYKYGILVVQDRSMGLMVFDNKFYFTDSHSCGAKGTGKAQNGRACIIECDEVDEMLRIVRRTVGFRANVQYSLNGIAVAVSGVVFSPTQYVENNIEAQVNGENSTRHCQDEIGSDAQFVPIQISVMAPLDHEQPDTQDEIHEGTHINEIVRKTKEYLFYALSMFEYYRVQSTINACGRTVRGQQGVVEDLHLHLKTLRGTVSYWRTAHNELIAFIRCLGPPTWFITLSCNDLNWLDMRFAYY